MAGRGPCRDENRQCEQTVSGGFSGNFKSSHVFHPPFYSPRNPHGGFRGGADERGRCLQQFPPGAGLDAAGAIRPSRPVAGEMRGRGAGQLEIPPMARTGARAQRGAERDHQQRHEYPKGESRIREGDRARSFEPRGAKRSRHHVCRGAAFVRRKQSEGDGTGRLHPAARSGPRHPDRRRFLRQREEV